MAARIAEPTAVGAARRRPRSLPPSVGGASGAPPAASAGGTLNAPLPGVTGVPASGSEAGSRCTGGPSGVGDARQMASLRPFRSPTGWGSPAGAVAVGDGVRRSPWRFAVRFGRGLPWRPFWLLGPLARLEFGNRRQLRPLPDLRCAPGLLRVVVRGLARCGDPRGKRPRRLRPVLRACRLRVCGAASHRR